jgi:hypothetical protein
VAEVQKTIDQAEQTRVEKTPEKAAVSAVIGGQANQEVHGEAHAASHANDKTLSEPDMIAMEENETVAAYKARVAQIQANRFGFFDSEEERKNDAGAGVAGKTKIHEHPAKQAVEPLPVLSPTVQQPPYESSVKANVQITNVPEVSEGVQQDVLGKYAQTVLENAAAAVRQIENHLAQPNAINSDFMKIGQWVADVPGHLSQSADQLNKDAQAILDNTTAQIDKPLSPEERAKMAGILLPMFFFEGGKEPINPETIEQMGLEGMSEAELKALGIEKRVEEVTAVEAKNIGSKKIPKDVRSSEIANQEALEMGIEPKPGSLSNIEARDWYNAQVAQIETVEQEMRMAGKLPQEIFEVTTELRNNAKRQARDLMKDRRAAARLDKESPILPPEEYLTKYGGDYEKAIDASKRTNSEVNARIERLRKEREQDL